MVPEVGREATVEVRSSIDAMAALTERVIHSGAKTVVLISPHAPLDARAFVAYDGPELYGDFAMFRAPGATVQAPLDEELLQAITRAAADDGLITLRIQDVDLDHGTTVPLYFLQRNGWSGRAVALGYSFVSNEEHIRFGRCIRRAIEQTVYPVAFIASGDLSHRLKPEAPAGYNPDAHLFDEEIVAAIRANATSRIVDIDQELRRSAGECGYRSMLVALGVAEGASSACEVISYEAPFGVGYLVAQLVGSAASAVAGEHSESLAATSRSALATSTSALPTLARQVIETFITEGKIIEAPKHFSPLLGACAACFVSIKTLKGDLRGCIGTIEPTRSSLGEELIANAISAATRDPRFPPVQQHELPRLRYSVDVLSPAEPTTAEELDPKVYGVIVEDESGLHRGLLLPNLEGIETVNHQIEIASRKAGIPPGSRLKLFRFRAERYGEGDDV
jgi:AmmeMemoRadiSam system protein A/AmmeMemoRadiSam system protein B